jgi:hypothetical protein
MELYIYISFTLVGVFAKLWALSIIHSHWKKSTQFYLVTAFVLVFLFQSTFELMLYFYSKEAIAGKIALSVYYVCAAICISILPFMVANLARYSINVITTRAIVGLCILVCILLIATKSVIDGVDHTGIALTRIPGPYYWTFQVLVIGCIFYTLFILLTSRKQADGFLRVRTSNILLVFYFSAPFSIIIIALMQFFEGVNAVGLLPIFVAVFVVGITDNICNHKIVDYSYWIPFSKKRQDINKLIKPFIEIQSDGLDPEIKKEYNKLIAQHALELFDGNQTKAAEWLQVSQSWVSRNQK